MIIGFIASAFDLLHPGHLLTLEECKNNCDTLIVGLHTDPSIERPSKNKPIETTLERYLRLNSCQWVDKIIPYDTEADLLNLLKCLKPNKRFLGTDYLEKNFTGMDLPIEIHWIDRSHSFSSSNLRKRIKEGK